MRLGIAVWRGHVSPVFDVAATLLVLDIEAGREVARHVIPLGTPNQAHRAQGLVSLGIDVLVCGAISRPLEQRVTAAGIRVVSLVSGPIDRVAEAVVAGRRLPADCLMPGQGRR